MSAKTKTNDIAWPVRPRHGDPMRLNLATALTELLNEQKLTAVELAGKVFGLDPKTKRPAQADAIRSYLNGEKFPSDETATAVAKALKVPLSRLLKPKGALIAPTPRVPRTSGASSAPPPPLDLPKDAPPLTFELKDYKRDPRFATVTISGTVEIDVAMAIFALVHRK